MKGNVIQMNTLHLNSVRLNGIGKVQSVSLKGGSTEAPVFPPVEPPVEPTPTYTLSASVTNGKVSAKRNGSAVNLPFTANEGDTIVLEVTPNDGYTFEGWADGNTDNPRTITMTADVVLSAECVEVVQPPVGNYIQFADAEVERVLMSNGVSSDGVGITMEDAERVTDIARWFKGNTTITFFNEFQYFTGVKTIQGGWDNGAFYGCSNLRSIKFPPYLSVINACAFQNCSSLDIEINIPTLTAIQYGIFHNTRVSKVVNLGEITSIPNAGKSDSYTCFGDNPNLKSARIPSSVSLIGNKAFVRCTGLEEIICDATTPPQLTNVNAFEFTNDCPIYVPDASLEAYKTATNWNQFADRIHPLSEIEGSLVFYDKLVGDGTAYINTEYYPTSWDNVEWKNDAPATLNKYVFGVKGSNKGLALFCLPYGNTSSYYAYQGNEKSSLYDDDNTQGYRKALRLIDKGAGSYERQLLNLDLNTAVVIKDATSISDAVCDRNLIVFASTKTDGSLEKFFNGAIRSLIITDARTNEVKLSLRPCTWNGEAGMWDEVNGKFYGNAAASGEFSVAND